MWNCSNAIRFGITANVISTQLKTYGVQAALCGIGYPERFKSSADVGAYFGLTPRQFQSGQVDYQTGISKRGDPMVRCHLVGAATVLLTHTKKWCPLKAWGVRLAKKQGMSKARVAVARKLAILMHRMWIDGKDFRWEAVSKKELEGLVLS